MNIEKYPILENTFIFPFAIKTNTSKKMIVPLDKTAYLRNKPGSVLCGEVFSILKYASLHTNRPVIVGNDEEKYEIWMRGKKVNEFNTIEEAVHDVVI